MVRNPRRGFTHIHTQFNVYLWDAKWAFPTYFMTIKFWILFIPGVSNGGLTLRGLPYSNPILDTIAAAQPGRTTFEALCK